MPNIYSSLFKPTGVYPQFDIDVDTLQDWLQGLWGAGSTMWNPTATGVTPVTPPGGTEPINKPFPRAVIGLSWPHLMYAYMIENTMVYEVFLAVLRELLTGERLSTPDPRASNWLRLTESVFYRHPSANLIYGVESEIRMSHRATRRNAYERLFGMGLNHPLPSSESGYYVRPEAANRDFVSVFEEFLREAWIGIINVRNTSGANPTDTAKIRMKAEELEDMLNLRRMGWNLAREEFYAVTLMSWFEYTLLFDTPIVKSLSADAPTPALRLAKIAARVGIPCPRMADDYFKMAEPLSFLLQNIEMGLLSGGVTWLLDPPITDNLRVIIDHWSRATGRDLKSTRVMLPTR